MRNLRILTLLIFTSICSTGLSNDLLDMSEGDFRGAAQIARAIKVVQPRLPDHKYLEYGFGIYRASKKYGIQPHLIVAITQQESGFRENLPEGRAGERGLCQIIKRWLKHPRFRKEFNNPKIKDLETPKSAFMMAAWLLKDAKENGAKSSLPYWAYYNSNRFENRFKYFLLVNKRILTLRKAAAYHAMDMEGVAPLQVKAETPKPAPKANKTTWLAQAIARVQQRGGNSPRLLLLGSSD